MLSRSDFTLRDDIVFLNHGSFGSCPAFLLDRQQFWIRKLEEQPVLFFRESFETMKAARVSLGGYLGADPDDFIYVTNSTYGVNVVAHALKSLLLSGDEILMTDHEYGACDRAWELHLEGTGVELVRQPIPIPAPSIDGIEELIWSGVTAKTKVLYLSHITSPTAVRLPVEALCKRARGRGIITVIDGAHAPGHIGLNLDELDADFYTANCHKWMCTPKGSAFLWVNKIMQKATKPLIVSWGNLLGGSGNGSFLDDHEYLGTRDPSPFLVAGDAVQWMKEHQWEKMLENLRALRNEGLTILREDHGLLPTSDCENNEVLMGAVCLPTGTDVQELKNRLYDNHNIEVVVLEWLGTPVLRFSVHAHTSRDDLRKLSTALSAELA